MISKSSLKAVILDQKSTFNKGLINYIPRDIEGDLYKNMNTGFIIIISGIRRAGKSTLLNKIRNDSKEKNYYLNFDDERLINFTVDDFQTLIETFLELYGKENTFYFDEIQNIKGWERFIRRLHDENKNILLTGSNSSMLSSELGTHLTGRYLEWTLFPFSFKEFLDFNKIKIDIKKMTTENKVLLIKTFKSYLKNGGFPEYLRTQNPDVLRLLYENIIYKDVITRYNLTKEQSLKDLVHFISSNVGKEVTFGSLAKIIGVIKGSTVKDYLSYLENSFLSFILHKYDYSLKKQFLSPKKVYLIDTGLINTVGFRFSEDIGRILENIIFLELKRNKNEIFYYKNKN